MKVWCATLSDHHWHMVEMQLTDVACYVDTGNWAYTGDGVEMIYSSTREKAVQGLKDRIAEKIVRLHQLLSEL